MLKESTIYHMQGRPSPTKGLYNINRTIKKQLDRDVFLNSVYKLSIDNFDTNT